MKEILKYLTELELNNNREWLQSTKAERQKVNLAFEELLGNLIKSIGKFDTKICSTIPLI